jgi:hypothetical protein
MHVISGSLGAEKSRVGRLPKHFETIEVYLCPRCSPDSLVLATRVLLALVGPQF